MTARHARLEGALWGLFAGDALAMPVHWYYDLRRLTTDFGSIQGYEAPKEKYPGSILSLSSTSSGGRGGDDGEIIGGVINHGKRPYWKRGANYFYHCTLQQGENTLEAQIARVTLRSITKTSGTFQTKPFLQDFVAFMTTPGTHNDTYASTYLRIFFANFARGVPAERCAGNDGHNVDAIDALTVPGVVAVTSWARGDDVATAAASVETYLRCLRRSDALPVYGRHYTELLYNVLNAPQGTAPATALRTALTKTAAKVGLSLEKAVSAYKGDSNPMVACYIGPAFNAALIIAYKYADDPGKCLLASANAGGENVARGSVLGTLMGAAYGNASLPEWLRTGLLSRDAIGTEIRALVDALPPSA
eukprot:m.160423 g.160423  ORF g.160423 m.160423 type:complete len:362 (+) comp11946_c0_seq1:179-1264(+)